MEYPNSEIFDNILPFVLVIYFVFWCYCIWFHNKYDKSKTRLLFLVFGQFFYVPFYIPIMLNIRQESMINKALEFEIDTELLDLTRSSIVLTLNLWAFKEEQILFSKNIKTPNSVVVELFNQWNNCYNIDESLIINSFNEVEIEFIYNFNQIIEKYFPYYLHANITLEDFHKSETWEKIRKEAQKTIARLE